MRPMPRSNAGRKNPRGFIVTPAYGGPYPVHHETTTKHHEDGKNQRNTKQGQKEAKHATSYCFCESLSNCTVRRAGGISILDADACGHTFTVVVAYQRHICHEICGSGHEVRRTASGYDEFR